MKTCVYLCEYLAVFFLTRQVLQICRENQNTQFMFSSFISRKSCRLWDKVLKYNRSRQATDENVLQHRKCDLHAWQLRQEYRNKILMWNLLLRNWLITGPYGGWSRNSKSHFQETQREESRHLFSTDIGQHSDFFHAGTQQACVPR